MKFNKLTTNSFIAATEGGEQTDPVQLSEDCTHLTE